MSENRTYIDFVQDIVDAIDSIFIFIQDIDYYDFIIDDKTFSAVVRKFEIIGEASNRITKNIQNEYPNIPWKYMVGIRNKIIHDYDGINKAIIWDTIQNDLAGLSEIMKKMLNELKKENINP